MFSFLSSAGDKITKTLQDFGYFDWDEMSKIKAKLTPGLELLVTPERLQNCNTYNSTISTSYDTEIGIVYRVKYGELGASVVCNSRPTAKFTATWRRYDKFSGVGLSSQGVLDIKRQKLNHWNLGLHLIAGNTSAQLTIDTQKHVIATRHRIQPGLVLLTNDSLWHKDARKSVLSMGVEWELHPRAALQVMFSDQRTASFALKYQLPRPQCVVTVYGDALHNKTGVSVAFHPPSFF